MNNLFVRVFQMMAWVMLLWPFAGATGKSGKSRETKGDKENKENTQRQVGPSTCVEEVELYEYPGEDPDGGSSYFDEDLQQYFLVDKPLYLDKDFVESVGTTDAVCNSLGEGRFLCNVVTTDDLGITTSTGIVEFDNPEDFWDGTGTFVFTGGTDMYAGVTGKVTSVYTEDINVHTVCIQEQPRS
jgi:hypothetical protein